MNFHERLEAFSLRHADTATGRIAYRCAGDTAGDHPPIVLLHGIGSASASWIAQLHGLQQQRRVLAWDAPGYGESQALPEEKPSARDYAQRLWDWLDVLQVTGPVALVGHSLGALMAAGAARIAPERISALVLLAPAQGYAHSDPATRSSKLAARLARLRELGPQGLAESRAGAMLSATASPDMLDFIRQVMAGINVAGYTQAAQMLAHGDLLGDLLALKLPLLVASGSADSITPLAGCQALASALGAPYVSLGAVGHACALEAADAVNALLARQGAREPADAA